MLRYQNVLRLGDMPIACRVVLQIVRRVETHRLLGGNYNVVRDTDSLSPTKCAVVQPNRLHRYMPLKPVGWVAIVDVGECMWQFVLAFCITTMRKGSNNIGEIDSLFG